MGGGGGCGGGAGGGCGMMRTNNVQQNYTPSTAPIESDGNEQVLNTVYTLDQDIVPSSFTVKKDKPVRFVVDVRENGYGCMSTIMVPGLYDNPELLKAGKNIVMNFTPAKTGTYEITCAMGVSRGQIKVVD